MELSLAIRKAGFFLFVFSLLFSSFNTSADVNQASIDRGLDWLDSSRTTEGSIYSDSTLSMPEQSTFEAAIAFNRHASSYSAVNEGIALLSPKGVSASTEELSQLILLKRLVGQSVDDDIVLLTQRQNDDGGFGTYADYESTALETAFALSAYFKAGLVRNSNTQEALSFLIAKQKSDGSWDFYSNNGNFSKAYVTAYALEALWLFRNSYSINSALDKAQAFLLGQRNTSNEWADLGLTAKALGAISPRLTNNSILIPSIESVMQKQAESGSWYDDAYVTALILQAFGAAAAPVTNPDLGSISGIIINGVSSEPLSGTVRLNDESQVRTASLDSVGAFKFDALPVGSYTLEFSATGFGGFSSPINLDMGAHLDFGVIALNPQVVSTTVTVRGVITREDTGAVLSGTTVNVNGATVTTGADGSYQFNNVPAGNLNILVSRSGFTTITASTAAIGGSTVVFSPALSLSSRAPSLQGSITDSDTQELLRGATITLSGANQRTVVVTSGSFNLTGLAVGLTKIAITLNGYNSVESEVELVAGATYNLSPKLTKITNAQNILQGKVVDYKTNLPISGVTVNLLDANSGTVQTDSTGLFKFEDINPGNTIIVTVKEGYIPAETQVVIEDGNTPYIYVKLFEMAAGVPSANVKGRVQEAESGNPVAGAVLEINYQDKDLVAISNDLGIFEFIGVEAGQWSGKVSHRGYDVNTFEFVMPSAVKNSDLGAIQLNEKARLPDLIIKSVNRRSLVSDPNNFAVTGYVEITVNNDGRYKTASPFNALAYYDNDFNGSYNAEVDLYLGRVRSTQTHIEPGESEVLTIVVSGQLPFRDAPIRIRIDTSSEVMEVDEDSNDISICDLAACGD